jgi:hypothetical protein
MKKSGLLNPQLCAAVARLGHTQTFVVADPESLVSNRDSLHDHFVEDGVENLLEPRGSQHHSEVNHRDLMRNRQPSISDDEGLGSTPSSTKWSWRESRLLTRLSGMNRNLG